ncbi:MAG: ABC transporter permease [Pseudomonadota bacterium]
MTKRDFKSKYLGSYLGLLWAFIHPMVTISVLWFVFEVGFKSKPVNDCPFILWLMTGMIPWFFFADAFASSSNCILEYSYLVKKVLFRVSTLPIVKILSAAFIHVFFILVILMAFRFYKYPFDRYMLQILYYFPAVLFLLLGISWLTSSLSIFLKDIGQVIAVLLQFGFWLTPIFWSLDLLPERYHPIIKLNPVYYIIQGYRDTFIHKVWFWQHPHYTIYFWSFALVMFVGGGLIFKRLKPHFADVL